MLFYACLEAEVTLPKTPQVMAGIVSYFPVKTVVPQAVNLLAIHRAYQIIPPP